MSAIDLTISGRASDYEDRLAQLWERNLGVSVSNHGDYFENGGDSLRGAQLLSWIQEHFEIEISLLDLFESRTIEAQARLLLGRLSAAKPETDKPKTEYRFFGPTDGRLFGALHRPGSNRGKVGVVLCYPMGQEYMRIHRTYVELARSLAASGWYVLRFDYFGCGDSAGDGISGNMSRWADDIRQAIHELRTNTDVHDVYLVGARIGANLALDVGAVADDIAGMVLWEPIVNGADYITALRRAHRDLLASNANLDGYDQHKQPHCFAELIGFPITKKLHDEVAAIDLLATPAPKTATDVLVLANSDKPKLKEYVSAHKNSRAKFVYLTMNESDGIWLKEDRQNKGIIPIQAIQTIISWISKKAT